MPTTTPTETLEEQRALALEQLAILGGKLMGEDDIAFKGRKFVLPEHLSLDDSIQFLAKRRDDDEHETAFTKTFKYRPYDGARATGNAIREAFGFTMGKTLYTFFGKNPPQMVEIATGPYTTESVPWGAMLIPGLEKTTVYLQSVSDRELGPVFRISVEGPRKYRYVIEGLFKLIEKHLTTDSIYRGKAIDGGDEYIDTSTVDPEDVVYTAAVQAQLEANVWSPIRHAKALAKLGQPGKRTVLFEGPYGTGKSLAALLTAQVAEQNGWTFVMCRPGKDDLERAMQTARIYQPAVVFFEDIDTIASPSNDPGATAMTRVLDVMDGITTKGLKMLVVMTTNHADRIHKGMVRPGRLDAVIHVAEMDRGGVEKLIRRTVGETLAGDVDFDKVFDAMHGYMPAFVKEAIDRAVRYSVSVNNGKIGQIGTEELCLAADGLRDQLRLMEEATDVALDDSLGSAMRKEMRSLLNETIITDLDTDDSVVPKYRLRERNDLPVTVDAL